MTDLRELFHRNGIHIVFFNIIKHGRNAGNACFRLPVPCVEGSIRFRHFAVKPGYFQEKSEKICLCQMVIDIGDGKFLNAGLHQK